MNFLNKKWSILDIGSSYLKEFGFRYLFQILCWEGEDFDDSFVWCEFAITPGITYDNLRISPNLRIVLKIWRLNVLTIDVQYVKEVVENDGGTGGGTPPGDGPSDPLES